MDKNQRIHVFINFEGVLVPRGAGFPPDSSSDEEGKAYWCWAGQFTKLAQQYDASLVLRSSWTLRWPVDEIIGRMPRELMERVEGATEPIAEIQTSGLRRIATQYEVVARYVRAKRLKLWCVVDDRAEGWPDAELWRLVCPKPRDGLRDEKVMQVLASLLEAISKKS
ncbi:HAD domain-containing protein [Cupriavidus numazuensis]|uniref:HAD domain-containing protein n=1 Tax=Cupriavidus numazuensis TaxID=221992 RepID=UPI001BA46EDA|nr:HAD domain-containing protein [Cupriavidus numazuensis]